MVRGNRTLNLAWLREALQLEPDEYKLTANFINRIIEQATVPVLVDAGVGTASDAAIAMELGCDGILMNTAIAAAREPIRMARAMKLAVQGGREAYLAGRMPRRAGVMSAAPSSPMAGLIA